MKHEIVYMTAKQLGISEVEREGLLQLKGELERGEIAHAELNERGQPLCAGFNMQYETAACGTVACIGGWMRLRGQLRGSVDHPESKNLRPLFWPEELDNTCWQDITPPQAARAIGNFLATRKPRWREAVGEAS